MKEWKQPSIISIDICETMEASDYINICNEEYTDPNKKPEQHPDWVWCHVHNRWHPKDHGSVEQTS